MTLCARRYISSLHLKDVPPLKPAQVSVTLGRKNTSQRDSEGSEVV